MSDRNMWISFLVLSALISLGIGTQIGGIIGLNTKLDVVNERLLDHVQVHVPEE